MFPKITILANDYPYKGIMTNVFVQQLVNAMADLGVTVSVIASQSLSHCLFRHGKLKPRHYICTTKKGNNYDVYCPYSITFGIRYGLLSKYVSGFNKANVIRIVKKLSPDVLYSHFWHNTWNVLSYAKEKNIPLFVACGEGDDALDRMIQSVSSEKKKELCSAVSGVISVSSENKRKCLEAGLIGANDIIVLPNCVDTSLFHKRDALEIRQSLGLHDDDFVIVFVGSFQYRKGPDRLAEAITKLDDPQVKSIFIGKCFDGYKYDFHCDGIVYKGEVNHDELPQLLNCADVFVLPTLKEGCCNAIVEALACGLPVISSNGPFNDDILDETNAIRVNPLDVDEIAGAITYLKKHKDVCDRMRSVSEKRHDSYSIENRASEILKFICSRA